MIHITPNVDIASKACINRLLAILQPWLGTFDEDSPILDLIISKGTNGSSFHSSIALFLPGSPLQVAADASTPDKAVTQATKTLLERVTTYQAAYAQHATAIP